MTMLASAATRGRSLWVSAREYVSGLTSWLGRFMALPAELAATTRIPVARGIVWTPARSMSAASGRSGRVGECDVGSSSVAAYALRLTSGLSVRCGDPERVESCHQPSGFTVPRCEPLQPALPVWDVLSTSLELHTRHDRQLGRVHGRSLGRRPIQ